MTYSKVKEILPEWIITNYNNGHDDFEIITGNSYRMKSLVKKICSENGFIISILEELTDFFENHMKKYVPFFKTEIKRLVKNSPEKELSSEDWMKFLIKKEIVEVNAHISSKFTPHELNYHNNNLIDFSKGCFNGQEIIARMQYRGKLRFALKVTDNLHTEIIEPSICNKEGKKVGEILSREGNYGFIFFKNNEVLSESVYLEGKLLNID